MKHNILKQRHGMLYHYYLAQGWILLSYADMPLKDYEWWLSSKIANSWNQAPATMETPAAGTSGILMQNNLIMFAGEPQQLETLHRSRKHIRHQQCISPNRQCISRNR